MNNNNKRSYPVDYIIGGKKRRISKEYILTNEESLAIESIAKDSDEFEILCNQFKYLSSDIGFFILASHELRSLKCTLIKLTSSLQDYQPPFYTLFPPGRINRIGSYGSKNKKEDIMKDAEFTNMYNRFGDHHNLYLYRYIPLNPKIKSEFDIIKELFIKKDCPTIGAAFPFLPELIKGDRRIINSAIQANASNIIFVDPFDNRNDLTNEDFIQFVIKTPEAYKFLRFCNLGGQSSIVKDIQKQIFCSFVEYLKHDPKRIKYKLKKTHLSVSVDYDEANLRYLGDSSPTIKTIGDIILETPTSILRSLSEQQYIDLYVDFIKDKTGIIVSEFIANGPDLKDICILIISLLKMAFYFWMNNNPYFGDSYNKKTYLNITKRLKKYLPNNPSLRDSPKFKIVVLACWFNFCSSSLYDSFYCKNLSPSYYHPQLFFEVILLNDDSNIYITPTASVPYRPPPPFNKNQFMDKTISHEDLQNRSEMDNNFKIIADICSLSPRFTTWFFSKIDPTESNLNKIFTIILPKILSSNTLGFEIPLGPKFDQFSIRFIKLYEQNPQFYFHNYLKKYGHYEDDKNNDLDPKKIYKIYQEGDDELKTIVGFKEYLLELFKSCLKYPKIYNKNPPKKPQLSKALVEYIFQDLSYLIDLIKINSIFFCWIFGIKYSDDIQKSQYQTKILTSIFTNNPQFSHDVHSISSLFLKFDPSPSITNNPANTLNLIVNSVTSNQSSDLFFEILCEFMFEPGDVLVDDYKYQQLFSNPSLIKNIILKSGTGPDGSIYNSRCLKILNSVFAFWWCYYINDEPALNNLPDSEFEDFFMSLVDSDLLLFTYPGLVYDILSTTYNNIIKSINLQRNGTDIVPKKSFGLSCFVSYIINKYHRLQSNFFEAKKFINQVVNFKNTRQVIRFELKSVLSTEQLEYDGKYDGILDIEALKFALATNNNFIPLTRIAHKSILHLLRTLTLCIKNINPNSKLHLPQTCIELIILNFDFITILEGIK